MSLDRWRRQTSDLVSALATARALEEREMDAAREHGRQLCAAHEALALAQGVAERIQTIATDPVSRIVTRCIRAVYPDPYEFRITFARKRSRTEARMSFVRDGIEVDPISASGGGVVDVAAFGLRLACLMLSRPKPRKLLVLDEPFRFVPPKLRPRVRRLLERLSAEMGVQILLVTHQRALRCGEIVDVSQLP